MHRDNIEYGTETFRGLSSKQFVADLHDQGVARDDAIEAVSQMFGVPWRAAQLFVLSHPAWAEEETRPATWPWWRGAGF